MTLREFTESDIESIVNKLFYENKQFRSVEDAYQHLAQAMYDNFKTDSESDLILSRTYHSFDFKLLPPSLQKVAQQTWGDQAKENNKFITLMGTYGKKPEWRDRTQSKGHKTILLTRESLTKIPMVSRLLQQIGIDLGILLGEQEETGIEVKGISGTFGVFYVSPALDSPYIPAQDFVSDYGVKAAFGTGVMLPQGDIGVYIGFSRVPIDNEMAANIAPLMSLFWQRAFPLLEKQGMFTA